MRDQKDHTEDAIAPGVAQSDPNATVDKAPLSDEQLDAASGGLTIFIKDTVKPSGFLPTAWQVLETPRGY
ncbi:hypothetical protein GCM10007301_37970 [Azorhizobium oxalatiphilum]|uniref:Uncharacterized protein n=1 Tax=Azorhizobium oxalatiphilum TaxID=980631 RepID=A0A917C935_9HYPH|nr:hypothetical protein [Azorhizobium oxalatiphilum]GGF74516.1 hypothetical protein GCM10007301_37970 [Azorhizobium oxalatiphilum]